LAGREKKYARAFSRGDLAVLSVFGTESWTDYAQVVLQIMMVDSMAALEQKIDKLTAQLSKLEGLVDPTPPPPAPTP
jgi:cell division protein FtsB